MDHGQHPEPVVVLVQGGTQILHRDSQGTLSTLTRWQDLTWDI